MVNRCADQRPVWAELWIVSNELKCDRAALNCGQGGPETRNNHAREKMREKGQTEVAKTLETPVFSRSIEILTEKQ